MKMAIKSKKKGENAQKKPKSKEDASQEEKTMKMDSTQKIQAEEVGDKDIQDGKRETDKEAEAGIEENEEAAGGSSPEREEEVKNTPEYRELNDKHVRLYAEFENFRKRTSKEICDVMQRANANLLEKLIPTLENLTRAFSPEHKASKLEDFEAGIKMIFNEFKDVLEEAGLEEINPEGEPFDPNFHDALLQQNHDTVEEDHVVQVFEKGYKVKSKILKPAKVIVSKGAQ